MPVEADRPVGVALVEGAARRVVDGDELAKTSGVAQRPGRERAERSRRAPRPPGATGAKRVSAVEERSGEERREEERGGTGQGRERRGRRRPRAATFEEGRSATASSRQPAAEQQDEKERLALDVRREKDETRMDRGRGARREREAPASEDPRREGGEHDRRERSERGVGDLGERDPVGMPERGGDQENGITRCPEVERFRRQRVVTRPDQLAAPRRGRPARPRTGASRSPTTAIAARRRPREAKGRMARQERSAGRRRGTRTGGREVRGRATRNRTPPFRASSSPRPGTCPRRRRRSGGGRRTSARYPTVRMPSASLPFSSVTTTGRFSIMPTPRIATCGCGMIGVPKSDPKTPGFVTVNVPPWISSGFSASSAPVPRGPA